MSGEEVDTRDAEPACTAFVSDGHSILPHCVNCGWSESVHAATETPYVRSSTGMIHVSGCGHVAGLPRIGLSDLIDSTPLPGGTSVSITALCCGASPQSWLGRHHHDRWEASHG